MTHEEFEKVSNRLVTHCLKTLNVKRIEYATGGDRFHNFVRAAQKLGTTKERALMGMKVKHTVSIDDIVDAHVTGHPSSEEVLLEKFGDEINYLILLFGMLWEQIPVEE